MVINIFSLLLMIVQEPHGLDAMTVFLEFYDMIFTQYNTAIKYVRLDNAPELAFHDFFR